MKTIELIKKTQISYKEANDAVISICDEMFSGILHDLIMFEGVKQYTSAKAARRLILQEFAHNSFEEEGVIKLATVLIFINQYIGD